MKKITDKQRLDFLVEHRLDAPCLVNDDNDHGCVSLCESIHIAGEGVKITDFEKRAIRHGEIQFIPVDELPDGLVETFSGKEHIMGFSETHHHHVLTGDITVFDTLSLANNGTIYKQICNALYGKTENTWPLELTPFRVNKDSKLKHLKSFDKHETLPVLKGLYLRVQKTAYDYFAKLRLRVID